jgi:2-methylcitrate dehydratase PrpD
MVGAALVEGRVTLAEVSDEKVKDPKILKMAKKVTRTVDPSFKDYRSAAVTLKMKDGQMHRHDQEAALGSPELPASREMVEDKFLTNVDGVLPKKRAEAVIDAVAHLEELHRVSELMNLLRKD